MNRSLVISAMHKGYVLGRLTVTALVAVLVTTLVAFWWAPGAAAQDADDADTGAQQLTNAEFRWGVNKQSSGPSHGPGYNFLSAGDISDAITKANTEISQQDWKPCEENVVIQKRTSNSVTLATWKGTQTDQSGMALSKSSTKYSGLEMVFTGGTGTVDTVAGTARIVWEGTASVLFYSGLVYLTISNPVLTVNGSRAEVTATLGGHRTDRADSSVWAQMSPKTVTLASFDPDDIDLSGAAGFSATPKYKGVTYSRAEVPQHKSGANWGAFPDSFLDFAQDAGSGPFWYSTGMSDDKKVPLEANFKWDSTLSPEDLGCANGGSGDPSGSKGVIGEVLDDTVEDILRAAGTDISGTAEAWMDEAWKPLQPDAVNAAQAGAPASAGDAGDSTVVVEEEFAEQYEEFYAADAPMTAGTVGATLATISNPSPSGSAAPAAPASAPAALQTAAPVASNLPLSEVAYAQTSASSETGNPTHQWQWWVGAALLALAAGLFYQTVRRKD